MQLTTLVEMVGRRLKSLKAISTKAAALSNDDFDRERLSSFLTIDLFNLNAEWMRRYYIEVSTNNALRKNGKRIVIGRKHSTHQEAISYAIDKLVGADAKLKWHADFSRFFEPPWNSVNALPRLATFLSFPDQREISTAISAGRDAINTLRAARNYYAHRNIDNRSHFSNELQDWLSWKGFISPSNEILNRNFGAYPNLFSFWLDDSDRIAREVCELVR